MALSTVLGVITGIAFLMSHHVRVTVGDAWNWAYPDVVVGILAGAVVLLAVGLLDARRRIDTLRPLRSQVAERAREHDEAVFADLISLMPRSALNWVRDHDFNGPWQPDNFGPFERFTEERAGIEWRFQDADLEARRAAFKDASGNWLSKLAEYGAPVGAGNLYRIRPDRFASPITDALRARWKQEAGEVNEMSNRVVETYDALIEAGQIRGFRVLP